MIRKLAVLATAGLISTGAVAQSQGDFLFRVGVGHIATDVSSDNLVVGGTELDNTIVDIGNNTRPVATVAFMTTDNIALELLASWPFEHSIEGDGALAGAGKLGETKHLPPTLSLQYHFRPNTGFRPYAGVGFNYTLFFDDNTTQLLDDTLGGPSSLDIDDSYGVALQLGADFDVSDTLFLNVDVRWIDIEADATIRTANADGSDTISRIKADIDPWVVSSSIGFRF
jgi:outer membrane protein